MAFQLRLMCSAVATLRGRCAAPLAVAPGRFTGTNLMSLAGRGPPRIRLAACSWFIKVR